MRVAESIEIFLPIAHVGWASACAAVTFLSWDFFLPKKGPPEQVRIILLMVFGSWPSRHL